MELSRPLLKEEHYINEDLDSIDNEATIKHSVLLRRPVWISRVLYSPFILHLLLIVGYTACFIWLSRSCPSAGCAHRDVIYCNNA